jgi:hypothetical protein
MMINFSVSWRQQVVRKKGPSFITIQVPSRDVITVVVKGLFLLPQTGFYLL